MSVHEGAARQGLGTAMSRPFALSTPGTVSGGVTRRLTVRPALGDKEDKCHLVQHGFLWEDGFRGA